MSEKKKVHYSFYYVILAFVLFCSTMIGVIIYAYNYNKNYELIEEDYYQKELEYQTTLDIIKKTNKLEEKPIIKSVASGFEFQFPKSIRFTGGIVELVRYENGKQDRKFKLELDKDFIYRIPKSELKQGRYLCNLAWSTSKGSVSENYLIKKDIYWDF